MKMKELCEGERPREKMLARGVPSLGDAELLAVLLRSGTAGRDVLELSEMMLSAAGGSLVRLFGMSPEELLSFPGIGTEKACSIMAASELGKRFFHEKSNFEKQPLTGPRRVYEKMLPLLKGLEREELWVLFLNRAGYLTGRERMSAGGTDSTSFDAKLILQAALKRGASSIVLVHNHPAGNPNPSKHDIAQTSSIRRACASLGISLTDHVVVCDDSFYSFADERLYSANL